MADEPRQRRTHGGVSPSKGARTPASASAGTAYADFVYNGGAVIAFPQVYTTFWGPKWSDPDHSARVKRLNQFIVDLLASKYMNVLSQYGVGQGAGNAGSFVSASFVADVDTQLDAAGIAQLIQKCIDHGTLPEPTSSGNNIVLIIFLDESIAVREPGLRMCEPDSDNAFGFHFDFTTTAGNEFYYAVIPALHDDCIRNTCPSGGCSLNLNQTQEQRLTQVTSHEFIEMCTDPKFTTGWYGPQADENGDICNGQSANITVGQNTWNVQRQYSKTDDENSSGRTFCVLDAPSPMPRRTDGPAVSFPGVPSSTPAAPVVQRQQIPSPVLPKWTKNHTLAVITIPALIVALAFVSRWIGFTWAWVLNMLLLLSFISIMGQGIVGLKRGALIDDRNRISLSRLQLLIWTVLILSSIITAVILNVSRGDKDALAITLPQELWWLMGISTTSLVGSSLIKSTKKDGMPDESERQKTLFELNLKEQVTASTEGKLVVKSSPQDANWYDLFMGEEAGNGSQLDLGKVQMFYFTWILAISYGATLAVALRGLSTIHDFPSLSKGMVALIGISHAGYLTNKAIPHTKDG